MDTNIIINNNIYYISYFYILYIIYIYMDKLNELSINHINKIKKNLSEFYNSAINESDPPLNIFGKKLNVHSKIDIANNIMVNNIKNNLQNISKINLDESLDLKLNEYSIYTPSEMVKRFTGGGVKTSDLSMKIFLYVMKLKKVDI